MTVKRLLQDVSYDYISGLTICILAKICINLLLVVIYNNVKFCYIFIHVYLFYICHLSTDFFALLYLAFFYTVCHTCIGIFHSC